MPKLTHKQIRERFKCIDCKVCTSSIDEYYMVHDHIWNRAMLKSKDGMVCIGCLETRLGRLLTPNDFTGCPLNEEGFGQKSLRFLNRLGLVDEIVIEALSRYGIH